jgi:CubicO group peptidase (beta-lactamase class C family)
MRTRVLSLVVLFLGLSLACAAPARAITPYPQQALALAVVGDRIPGDPYFAPPIIRPTPTSTQAPSWIARVDSALQASFNNPKAPLAGLSAGVRVGDAPPVLYSYGMADIGQNIPATPDTPFQIASITKQFTAAAIMQLVEAGKISLDDPAVRFFPDLPASAVAAAQGIKIRHLLTHTSGLQDPVGWKFRDFELGEAIPDDDSQIDLASTFGQPAASPGASWMYNNTGFWILGRIVESVSGQSYGDYLQSHFFGPLGMQHTGYCPTPPPGAAVGYDYNPDTKDLHPVKADMRLGLGAAGLCSTAADLLTWQQALAGGKVVQPESYQQMITPVQLTNGSSEPYGFGLNINGQGSQAVISHAGRLSGFQSMLIHYPQGDITIAVLINTDNSQSAGTIAQFVILPRVVGK